MMLIATFALDPALAAMNVPEELFEDAKSYVLIISHGIIAMMGYNLLAGILRSLGDSKTPLYFLIIATILNIFLALLFIIQFDWGVPGSAVALVIAQGFSALLCIVYIVKNFRSCVCKSRTGILTGILPGSICVWACQWRCSFQCWGLV